MNEPMVTIPLAEYKELISKATVFNFLRRQVISNKYRSNDDIALFNIDQMEIEEEES